MPYVKDHLVARRGYFGDASSADVPWWQKLAGGLIGGYQGNQQQQAQQSAAQSDVAKAIAAQSGFTPTTMLVLGGLGVGAYLLLKKKRKA